MSESPAHDVIVGVKPAEPDQCPLYVILNRHPSEGQQARCYLDAGHRGECR